MSVWWNGWAPGISGCLVVADRSVDALFIKDFRLLSSWECGESVEIYVK